MADPFKGYRDDFAKRWPDLHDALLSCERDAKGNFLDFYARAEREVAKRIEAARK